MQKQITQIHLGIMNAHVHLRLTYNTGTVEDFLFDLTIAKQLQTGMGDVIEAIESGMVPREGVRVTDQAIVRLVEGGFTSAERN
mgnify:CR=1 FL=1